MNDHFRFRRRFMAAVRSASGFTLLELLVVISIIAVLAGLVVSLVGPLRLRVKLADTQVKMNAVHQGMALVGQSEGSATYRLQQLTERRTTGSPADPEPGLGGIITLGPPAPGSTDGLPTIGKRPPPRQSEDNGAWGERGRAHLAFPWGKKFPDKTPTDPTKPELMGPERFLLRHMAPSNTRKLLKIANILPQPKASDPQWAENQYMTNRKPSEAWNDAWGHPLVVTSMLYQPTHRTSSLSTAALPGWEEGAWPAATGTAASRSVQMETGYMPATVDEARKALLDHLKLYQYNRSVYIAVAAGGPSVRVTDDKLKSTTDSHWFDPIDGTLDKLWSQANWVCQQAKEKPFDQDWSELSFDNPMWQGNKYDYLTPAKKLKDANRDEDGYGYTGKTEHCLLSAPLEYR